MRAIDGISASFTTQTNGAQVSLQGGYYELSAVCSGWNSAVLYVEHLLPDGTTWLKDSSTLKLSANGWVLGYLSAGSYRLLVDTGTPSAAIYVALSRVPTD